MSAHPWDKFGVLAETIHGEYEYRKRLEKTVEEQRRTIESLRNQLDPGRERREAEAALDGEIRLMREQG